MCVYIYIYMPLTGSLACKRSLVEPSALEARMDPTGFRLGTRLGDWRG